MFERTVNEASSTSHISPNTSEHTQSREALCLQGVSARHQFRKKNLKHTAENTIFEAQVTNK